MEEKHLLGIVNEAEDWVELVLADGRMEIRVYIDGKLAISIAPTSDELFEDLVAINPSVWGGFIAAYRIGRGLYPYNQQHTPEESCTTAIH
jgi:hypothetical protein